MEAQGRQPQADAGRLVRRLGGGGRGRPVPGRHRHRHRRLDPPAGGVLPAPSASSRPTAAARAGASSPSPRSLDQAGPIARTVEDAAILLQRHGRPRPEGFHQRRLPVPDFAQRSSASRCKGLRIGIPKEYRVDGMPRRDRRRCGSRGIDWLKDGRREIVEVSLPHTKYALPAYYIVAPAEASSNLARYDGMRFGLRVDGREPDRDLREHPRRGLRRRGASAAS